ncbi:FadR/GntR family transcriptional regulator [Nonomuraea insulae]|uniref:FadR/GntR family transcriptional regulator n=1 Tax=Nonomuraea insulae TaxID=1616787 RepID=A0ABW1CMM4_9ACTN
MSQTPGSRKRLPEVIADRLQREIVETGAQPDDRLPTEVELVERYGVSRTVVREAARLLVQRGLVTVTPGRGMVVARFDGKLISEQFAMLMQASNGTFDQLLELRLAIEVQMAVLAAEGQVVHLIAAMQETIDRGEASIDERERFLEFDMAFHELLAESSGNPYFGLVSKPINEFMRSHYRNRASYPSDPRRTLEEHTEILSAIRRGDTFGARHATEEHLRRLRRARRNAPVSADEH